MYTEALSYTGARYGRGKGLVYLNNLQCSGSEQNLTECSRSNFGQVYSHCRDHSRDVSISCGSEECVSLSNSTYSSYVYLIAECPDSMFECKSGRVDGQTPPCISTQQRCDNIKDCLGGQDELDHSCPCEPDGAVRLVGGNGLHEGRVEFCRKSVWVTLCSRSYYSYWRSRLSQVVCRQLGYSSRGTNK